MFEENYALISNTVTDVIDPLMKCCVEEKIFTAEEAKEITASIEASEQLQVMLLKISDALKADNARGFYVMLKIMKEHGNKRTETLADHIMNRLKVSSNELSSQFCSGDNIHVQDDEPKGLSVVSYFWIKYTLQQSLVHASRKDGQMKPFKFIPKRD